MPRQISDGYGAASDPIRFGRLLGGVGLAPYLDPRPSTAQPDILGPLFGSPMLSQAVLQQASMASGVGAQALRQMLPVMAGMVVAGIVHVLLNQGQQPVVQPPPAPTPEPSVPVAWFWNEWANSYLGGAEPSKSEVQPQAGVLAPKPRETSVSTTDQAAIRPVASTTPPEPPEGRHDDSTMLADGAPFEAFQHILQTGAQVQEQNAKAMQTIFDAFWSAQPRDVTARTTPLPTPKPNDVTRKDAVAAGAASPAAARNRRSRKTPKPKAPAGRKRPAHGKKGTVP